MPLPDEFLEDEQRLDLGGRVIHTPGHSPGAVVLLHCDKDINIACRTGSVCLYFEGAGLLLSGDTLFRGNVGRTDLWGGDTAALKASIQRKLYVLPDQVRVITGHGVDTTIAFEKHQNASVTANL